MFIDFFASLMFVFALAGSRFKQITPERGTLNAEPLKIFLDWLCRLIAIFLVKSRTFGYDLIQVDVQVFFAQNGVQASEWFWIVASQKKTGLHSGQSLLSGINRFFQGDEMTVNLGNTLHFRRYSLSVNVPLRQFKCCHTTNELIQIL